MSLGNSLLLHSQAHNPFSVSAVSARYPTSEQGSSLSTQAEGRSLEGPQHWSQRAGTQGQLEKAGGATAIGFRGLVAWPYSPGLLRPPILSTEANYSRPPSKKPTKGNGLLLQHVRFRTDLGKSFLASHTWWEETVCMYVPGALGSVRQDNVKDERSGASLPEFKFWLSHFPAGYCWDKSLHHSVSSSVK